MSVNLDELKFCVFDLETTGSDPSKDKIIEIGLVHVDGQQIKEKKGQLINPERKIPSFIQNLTSITDEDVKDAPIIDDVIDEIIDFIGDRIVVAHNISFDFPFLNSVLERLGRKKLENKKLCTNLMTKYLIPDLLTSNLSYMSKIYNFSFSKAHRALDDAFAAAQLLIKYLNIFEKRDITKINHLYYPRGKFELNTRHINSKEEAQALIEHINGSPAKALLATIKGEQGKVLDSICLMTDKESLEVLTEKILAHDFKRTSIKIFGSFLEALSEYQSIYLKINHPLREKNIRTLSKLYLKDSPQGQSRFDNRKSFIVYPHLAPEQFVLTSISNHRRKSFIFRYPHQKKRFIQIFKKQSRDGSSQKESHQSLESFQRFFRNWVIEKSSSKEFILLPKFQESFDEHQLISTLDSFSKEYEGTSSYPQDHI